MGQFRFWVGKLVSCAIKYATWIATVSPKSGGSEPSAPMTSTTLLVGQTVDIPLPDVHAVRLAGAAAPRQLSAQHNTLQHQRHGTRPGMCSGVMET